MTRFYRVVTTLRPAVADDLPALTALIASSVRELSVGFYDEAQRESGLRYVFGVDTQLIADGTYFVCTDDHGALTAAGGWSRRRTLYGGDQAKSGPDDLLDPTQEPARIRAFFVHPTAARRGLARRLFEHCREAARREGFIEMELMATLPGVPLYTALGFAPLERADARLPDGVVLPMIRMRVSIAPS